MRDARVHRSHNDTSTADLGGAGDIERLGVVHATERCDIVIGDAINDKRKPVDADVGCMDTCEQRSIDGSVGVGVALLVVGGLKCHSTRRQQATKQNKYEYFFQKHVIVELIATQTKLRHVPCVDLVALTSGKHTLVRARTRLAVAKVVRCGRLTSSGATVSVDGASRTACTRQPLREPVPLRLPAARSRALRPRKSAVCEPPLVGGVHLNRLRRFS
jgi:hypothetical protein